VSPEFSSGVCFRVVPLPLHCVELEIGRRHWLTEQVFNWSGVPTTHLRVTFFAAWLLYIAHLIRQGRYVIPFDAESRFAPIPASDIARVIVGTLENPKKYAGATYQLHGPVEYSHQEIAGVRSKTLNKLILFEQVTVPEFLKLLGMEGDKAKQAHFEAVRNRSAGRSSGWNRQHGH
jgi:uncharacterized protein YbjT (DUF2867 family)